MGSVSRRLGTALLLSTITAPCLGSSSPDSSQPLKTTVFPSPTHRSNIQGAPEPTDGPQLERRDYYDTSTCGYDPMYTYYGVWCYGDCVASGDYWGCCTSNYSTDKSCTTDIQTACTELDYDALTWPDYNVNVMTCLSSTYTYNTVVSVITNAGFCMSYMSVDGDNTYTRYSCTDENLALTMLAASDDPTDGLVNTTPTGTNTDTSTGTNTDTSTGTSTDATQAAASTISREEMLKEEPKIAGAILGGVLGGIVLVISGTLAGVYMWIKIFPDPAESSAAPASGEATVPPASQHVTSAAVSDVPAAPAMAQTSQVAPGASA